MATNAATVSDVVCISSAPGQLLDATYGVRKVYGFVCSWAVDTGGANNAKITGVEAKIATFCRGGRTKTWQANAVQALCAAPGKDATQNIYAGTFAVSGEDVTFNLTDATGTELGATAAMTEPLLIYIAIDETPG